MSYTYEQWKKEQEEKKKSSYTYDVWKAEQTSKDNRTTRIQENKISSYNNLKKNTLQEIGTQIKTQNEERRKQEEYINNEIKKRVNNVNANFNKNNPQTVTLPTNNINNNYGYRNIMQENAENTALPTNMNLLKEEDKAKFVKTGKVGNGELFKVTKGAIDDRNNTQKMFDNVVAPISNLLVGIEGTLPSIANYENAVMKKISQVGVEGLARNFTDKENAKLIGDVVGGILYENNSKVKRLNKDLEKEKEWRNETIQYNINKAGNPLSKKVTELAPTLGQNILPMAVSLVPVPGARALSATMFMTSAGGNYLDDAKQRGMNDDEALGYATVMGVIEGGSEAVISGGMVSRVKKAFTGKALSDVFLNSLGTEITENFAQEAIMEPIQEATAHIIGGEETANWDNMGQRMLQSGIDGVLSALLLKGSSVGIVSSQNVVNKINNGQEVTTQELTTALNDIKNSGKVDIEGTVQGAVNAMQEKSAELNSQQNQTEQLPTANNIKQEQKQVAQNSISEQTEDMLNNKELPMQSYQYEITGNAKIDNFNKNASMYFNNSEKSRNFLKMLQKIITDKNIDIVFDENLKTADGRIANGSYSNGVITINPNSTRTGEFIAIHELTHAIGTKEMLNMINTYRNSNPEFDTAVKGLLKNYQGTEITEEALSDVAGQLFGNQEFINNIAQNNPNIFQKLYSEIKYLWHQFRGYKNQNQFVEDLYYKWTQAYNSNNKLNGTSNYSIAGINAVNNIKNNTSLYNEAMSNYNIAKNMARQGKNNTEIIEKTGWFKDDTGKLKFSFSDKYMDLKNINFQENRIYELEDILEHDTLFMFYPELRKYKVEFKDLNKNRKSTDSRINGAFSRKDKEIRLDIKRANSKIDTEGTLIHEIQHAIQNIEGFARGTSTKLGKRQYQKSLGEREARDTASRFINEKYNKVDMSNVLPESAIFNRNILDKMKDGLYNYLNKFNQGVSNEETSEINEKNNERNKILVVDRINEQGNSNESSFSMQDNQGRTLTKEQQEFFKDSKVRDENGNLLEVYHGTKTKGFNIFNYDPNRQTGTDYGKAYYFTTDYTKAQGYQYDIEKDPLYIEYSKQDEIWKEKVFNVENEDERSRLIKEWSNWHKENNIMDLLNNEEFTPERLPDGETKKLYLNIKNPYIADAKGQYYFKVYDNYFKEARANGNDGIIVKNVVDVARGEHRPIDVYIAFSENQIKNVDNTNPTSNPDIRYSISEDTQETRLLKLNEDFDLYSKTRDEIYDKRDNVKKEYDELINSEDYKNALKKVMSISDVNEATKTNEYQLLAKAQRLKNQINDYQDEIDIAYKEMTRIAEEIEKEEKQHRNPKDAIKQAKKQLGLTDNFNEAGYMLEDGSLLDFSGRNYGSGAYNKRTMDHREINEFGYEMQEFIELGNIRMQPESNGFELMKEPTLKQYNMLKEYIDNAKGEVFIDVYKDNKMHSYDSANYKSGTSSSKIISDLQYYFRNGKFPAKSEFADFRYSQNNQTWQQYLDKNFKPTGTRTSMQDILPTAKIQSTQNVLPTVENNVLPKAKKKLNPTEIANLTMEDANTTPELRQKHYAKGNKQSSFFRNVIEDAQFLNKDLRQEMSQDENIRYYKGITNAETLEKAYTDLQNGGQNETMRWFNKENKDISAEDVVKGWILLKQYQDNGDYQGAVEVAKKMRNMGTKAGQAVQAYNILSRLTPEGMFYYAQSELSEAYNKMAEGKSKEWIDDNKSKFDLTPEETQIIKEKMESIQGVEDERTKKIALAEIQKMITDKIPPTASQSIKSWMRISMLFNPKTQVRNVAGNAVILPVNMTSDFIASGIDRAISKKTGVRTTGNTNLKNYAKGFGKGLYESYDDFRKGINTRNIEGNRFEVTEGKNFKDKGIGKALNRVDNMLSFMLDAGDRGFYEATFTNSINNQLVLNNTTEVTQDMIDIATQEALQRTWQDNNTYTNAVLKIRKLLNFNKGYGLGDILIPFAKTPANLTKAIVDYSPVGLTKTLAIDARKFNNSLKNGQYTPQLQHKFVQDLGKGMAGSFLYVLGYALAKAGVITGESDDDKDVKNFMKNSLGINSYSIKIGDKSFAYDWAQPVATPFAIMANFQKYNKENPDASAIDKAINSINIGSEQLLQQSFMESINTVLNGNGTFVENLGQAVLELPSRAVPTLSKQVADMVDGTQRTSFEYDKPVESAINSVKAKLPFVSRTLPVSVDTLGNEIQKYGGDNNLWNVMFNPANMNKGELSKAGEEMYNVYMETGDATILPRTAPYYINSKGEKKTMTSTQRSEFQKITGKYVESTINGLLNNKDYKKLSNDKKAELINEIVSDSYSKAKYDILNIDSDQYEKLRNTLKSVSTTSYYDYKSKTEESKKDSEKLEVLVDADYTKKEKQTLYETYIKSEKDEKYDIIKTTGLDINTYLKYKLADSNEQFSSDKKDNGTIKGKTITNSAKNKRYSYINSINATEIQKLVLFGLEYEPSTNADKQKIINYISSLNNKTNKEKLEILSKFKGTTIYKNGTFNW